MFLRPRLEEEAVDPADNGGPSVAEMWSDRVSGGQYEHPSATEDEPAAEPAGEPEDEADVESTAEDVSGAGYGADDAGQQEADEPAADSGDEGEQLHALAEAYGFSKEEVEGMTLKELQRYGKLMDSQAFAFGRALAPPQQPVQETQQKPGETQEPPADPFAAMLQTLKDEQYDEQIVGTFEAVTKQLAEAQKQVQDLVSAQQRMQQEAQVALQQQQMQAEQRQFFDTVDGLGREDLFGSNDSFDPAKHQPNIDKLADTVHMLRLGLQRMGRDSSLNKTLLERAYRYAFGDQIRHEDSVKKAKAVHKQSRRRMGQGTPSGKGKEIPSFDGPLSESPELRQWAAKHGLSL